MKRFLNTEKSFVWAVLCACVPSVLNPAHAQQSPVITAPTSNTGQEESLGHEQISGSLFDLKLLRRNVYTALGPNVRGTLVGGVKKGVVGKFVYDLDAYGGISSEGNEDNDGPALTYGKNHRFVFLPANGQGLEVAFQTAAASQLKVLRIGRQQQLSSLNLPLFADRLGAINKDSAGNYYYFTTSKGKNPKALLVKADNVGQLLASTPLGNGAGDFDILGLDGSISNLCLGGNSLCFLTSRTMQSGHQGSIIATFNTSDLSLAKNYGSNASHSFDNRLIYDGRFFVSLDLADNYPRGIIIHKIAPQEKAGKVIFTYKTHLANTDEATRKGHKNQPLTAWHWSNDNRTYSELADVIPTPQGYLVVFASESSVDNKLATGELNEPRNIGAVLVTKKFETVEQNQYIVNDDLILSQGKSSGEFDFYDFGGGRMAQKNTGVMWLTDYRDKEKETAARPKVLALGAGRYLMMWEKWTHKKFLTTQAMTFDERGQSLSTVIDLGSAVRLSRGDNPVVYRNQIIWPTLAQGKLEINIWEINNLDNAEESDTDTESNAAAESPLSTIKPRAQEIMLEGIVQEVAPDGKSLTLQATKFALFGTAFSFMSKSKRKTVLFAMARVHSTFGVLCEGQRVQVVGKDEGTGTALTAREILVLAAPSARKLPVTSNLNSFVLQGNPLSACQ